MADVGHHADSLTVGGRLRTVVWGRRDPRVRASLRVLIAATLLVPPSEGVALSIAGALGLSGPLPIGVSQAAFIAIVLFGWSRYVDRRRFSDYGFSASGTWLVDLVVGFTAVLVGFGAWLGLGTVLGWAEVELTASPGTVVLGLGTLLVAVALNVWVQETVYTGVVIKNAAEGLAARGVTPTRAVIGAWLVGALLYAWIHDPSAPARAMTLLLGLGLYGLLYVHTGELALPIGVHAGVNYAGGVLIASPTFGDQPASLFQVTKSLPGVLGSLSELAIPQLLVAYLLIVGWLTLRRGDVGIETGLTRWSKR